MNLLRSIGVGIALSLAVAGCGGSGDPTPTPTPADGDTLYARLGGEAGITTVINDFVGIVVADARINGYFLNADVDGSRLTSCLITFVGDLAGGPEDYAASTCLSMKVSHQGMGVSSQDYADLAEDLVMALNNAGVAQSDIDIIVAALTEDAFVADIVEDPDDDATAYQRVGRKPAIQLVVDSLITRVVADTTINGFFASTDASRLDTCLVRQVCGLDGPCEYGAGVEAELNGNPCRSMAMSHAGLSDPPGGTGEVIMIEDFNALVGHLIDAMDEYSVAQSDQDIILGALGATCTDIVAGGTGCP